MAVSKRTILTIFQAFIILFLTANVIVDGEAEDFIGVVRKDDSDSDSFTFKIESKKLNSKIQELESLINGKSRELEKKDDIISQKDKIFEDKSYRVSFLQSKLESLQREGKLHAEEIVAEAIARAVEFEKQVNELERELDAQNREKDALEAQSKESKEKMLQFISKLEKRENDNEKQKTKIRKIERALKVAEEEMVKAKFEATSKTKELMEVHGAWFPPWLVSHWNKHAKPAVNLVSEKVLVGKAQLDIWVGPGVKSIQDVKATIQEVLNKHDFTRPFATNEMEWFLVLALLAFPIIVLFSLCACIFRKKPRKPVQSANSNHVRRKAKRGSSGD